jgi:DHA2 family multidrug resistance protein
MTNIPAREAIATLAARFQGSEADIMASKKLMAIVRLQAAVLSYADVFFILTVLFLGFGVLGLLMKRPRGPAIEGK